LTCPRCGQALTDEARVCASCGEPVSDPTPGSEPSFAATARPAVRHSVAYAGFWIRAAAYILDSLLIALVALLVVFVPLVERGAIPMDVSWNWFATINRQTTAIRLLIFMISWIYFASFESSRWQATPGKRLFRLLVTDLKGHRITFTRASGRYLGKLIFGVILTVGFLFAAFMPKKQAVHDLLASTLVLRIPKQP
jgi:uncharacterized RDD family membrane protein YckC